MVFWSIVLGVIALLLVFGWRVDRRNRGTGRVRQRKIYDGVRIEEAKAFKNQAETGHRGLFRRY